MPLVHHELFFGCGRSNLFGLLLEAEPSGEAAVAGRCFIKQDHQGGLRGHAHDGIVATALVEAMTLAAGGDAITRTFELQLHGAAPVGEFVEVEARVELAQGLTLHATAQASAGGAPLAQARGTLERVSAMT